MKFGDVSSFQIYVANGVRPHPVRRDVVFDIPLIRYNWLYTLNLYHMRDSDDKENDVTICDT